MSSSLLPKILPVLDDTYSGTLLRYSGGGTTVAQQAVVDVLRKPFPELMRDLVLAPIGLKNSTYEQPLPTSRMKQAATGHLSNGHAILGLWHIYPEMAAAGLWSTPSDLATLGIEVQMALKGDTRRLLLPETVHQMLTPQNNEPIGILFS